MKTVTSYPVLPSLQVQYPVQEVRGHADVAGRLLPQEPSRVLTLSRFFASFFFHKDTVDGHETFLLLQTGEMVRLSEQQMVDCTWKVRGVWNNSGNHGCHGGMAWKVFFWGRSNTIATSDSYGSYKGQVFVFCVSLLMKRCDVGSSWF